MKFTSCYTPHRVLQWGSIFIGLRRVNVLTTLRSYIKCPGISLRQTKFDRLTVNTCQTRDASPSTFRLDSSTPSVSSVFHFEMVIMLGTTSYLLMPVAMLLLVVCVVDYLRSKKKQTKFCNEDLVLKDPPGPTPWPVLGSLHILGQYDVPYKAFGYLRDTYNSNIVKIKLGSVSCIVVNGIENIREVLIHKGSHFDSRPNFKRFDAFFDGDRKNCK